ncbi:hypothetical protein CHUAL_003170 [Chamberlinius hualienensis]
MLLSNLKIRDLGIHDSLKVSYEDMFIPKLRCSRQESFSCPSKGLESNVVEVPPFVAKFSPVPSMENILLLASEDGDIFVHNTLSVKHNKPIAKIDAHDNAIFDLCWWKHSPFFVTASGDKTASLWDFSTQTKLLEFRGHQCSIKSVDVQPEDNSVFATGGRDGNIIIWDKRTVCKNYPTHAVNILRNVHQMRELVSAVKSKSKFLNESYHGVTNVLFHDYKTLISSGAVDGDIKFWDIRRSYGAYRNVPLPVKCISYPGKSVKQLGYTSMVLDSNGCRLFASCTDNAIYEFNASTCDLVGKYTGHKCSSSFFVKSTLCPQDRYLLSGSMDEYAYIWKIGESQPLYKLGGHADEVTSVDWSKTDELKIATCCDDMKYRIWRTAVNGSELQPGDTDIEKLPNTIGRSRCKKRHVNEDSANVKRHVNEDSAHVFPTLNFSPLQEINWSKANVISPTLNLPNLVLDQQKTPKSVFNCKSRSTPRQSSNWLTLMASATKRPSVSKSTTKPKKSRKKSGIDKCLENYFLTA